MRGMVNNDNENNEEYENITDEQTDMTEPEIEEIEDAEAGKLKKLRDQLKQAEEDKKTALEELANVKADYLNARKRLEEESIKTIERKTDQHVTDLLPLADSFVMAMSNKEVWEQADANWRKGIEGIYAQLLQVLRDNGVEPVDPTGEEFDPNLHDAINTEEVDNEQDINKVLSVMQLGYQLVRNGQKRALRPARVTIGVAKETQE
jgi:molecular chaperone GrpE